MIGKFGGFSFNREEVTEQVSGFNINFQENFYIQVKNEAGEFLICTIIVLSGGGVTGEYTKNPLNLYVEGGATSISLVIRAASHITQTDVVNHPGGDNNIITKIYKLKTGHSRRIDLKGKSSVQQVSSTSDEEVLNDNTIIS